MASNAPAHTGSVRWQAHGTSNGRASGTEWIRWPTRCGRRLQKVFVPCGGPVCMGPTKLLWALTQGVRLQRYGRKRLVLVQAQQELGETPRLLLTDAWHWDSRRVLETWRYRWPSVIFPAFGKQVCGLEAAQVRKEEAVKRHFRWRCVAQSLRQQAPASGAATERLAFAQGAITIGQKGRTRARDALQSLLQLVEQLLAQGHSCEHLLGGLMPA